MKRAIREHRTDFLAVLSLLLLAVLTVGYILKHQPAFTFGRSYYTVSVPFSTAAAVTAGQGQAVTIAGVQVGLVGGVSTHDGVADVTMNLYKRYAPIYRNATVLERPRTPLKDMYLALDPGTRAAGSVPNGGALSLANTQPDIDVDQILSSLDADTRNYLLLLLAGGAEAFGGRGAHGGTPSRFTTDELSATFKRFAPLDRDTRTFSQALATRSDDLRHAIHNLDLVVSSLGGVDVQLASLVRAANTDYGAISSQDAALERGLGELPSTLRTATSTLTGVEGYASASTTALHGLLPFARELGPALAAVRPLARDTTPAIRTELRPFSVAVQPLARTLAPAAAALASATPKLNTAFGVLNVLFDELAHQPGGSGHSYLFWGAWLSHIANTLTDMQDANGPLVQGLYMSTCNELNLLEVTLRQSVPSLASIIDLLNPPDYATIHSSFCPAGGL